MTFRFNATPTIKHLIFKQTSFIPVRFTKPSPRQSHSLFSTSLSARQVNLNFKGGEIRSVSVYIFSPQYPISSLDLTSEHPSLPFLQHPQSMVSTWVLCHPSVPDDRATKSARATSNPHHQGPPPHSKLYPKKMKSN